MAHRGNQTHQFWLPNRSDDHTVVLIKILTSLQSSLRVMGNFRKKKKTTTFDLKIFLSIKNFSTEYNKRSKFLTNLSLHHKINTPLNY